MLRDKGREGNGEDEERERGTPRVGYVRNPEKYRVCVCVVIAATHCCTLRQTAYVVVDDTHAVLPEIARDQYWDELEINVPYTAATHQTRRDDYTATADNIELVYSNMLSLAYRLTSLTSRGHHQVLATDVRSVSQNNIKLPKSSTPLANCCKVDKNFQLLEFFAFRDS